MNKKGFTIIEMVVVPAILLMIVLAVMNTFDVYVKSARGSLNSVKASYLLEEGVEVVKIFRDDSWNKKISPIVNSEPFRISWNGSSWATSSSQVLINGIFDRYIILDNVYRDSVTKDISTSGDLDQDTKKVTVYISWSNGKSTTTKSLSTYITNLFGN